MYKIAQLLALAALLSFAAVVLPAEELLIVADEAPFTEMEAVAGHVKRATGLSSKIIAPDAMPGDLAAYKAVLVYIHRDMAESTEEPLIAYARNGGKLILLHHSISSFKRKSTDWFPFLGVQLPAGERDEGGYKFYAPVSYEIVNLAAGHYITSHDVRYDEIVPYVSSRTQQKADLPGTKLSNTEVYVNHQLSGERTILLGVKYKSSDGKTFMQDIGGWLKQTGKGVTIYLMPGHSIEDVNNPVYRQIVINAVTYQRSDQTAAR